MPPVELPLWLTPTMILTLRWRNPGPALEAFLDTLRRCRCKSPRRLRRLEHAQRVHQGDRRHFGPGPVLPCRHPSLGAGAGGEVSAALATEAAARPLAQAGRLRMLATTGAKRSPF